MTNLEISDAHSIPITQEIPLVTRMAGLSLAEGDPLREGAHILVVDDEAEIAESLSEYLTKKEGYRISVVSNGREALDFLQASLKEEKEIDLVLLDMRMPVMSGLEVLAWIRRHPELQYMRVVLLTAATGSQDKVRALSAGADDYITKPYFPQELLARVKTILRTQHLEKQLQRQSQQLAALNRVGQVVAATFETYEVLMAAVEGVEAIFGVELAAAMMVEGGKLKYQVLRRRESVLPAEGFKPVGVDRGILGHVFTEQRAILLNHPSSDPRFDSLVDAPPYIDAKSMMVAPLVVRDRSVGMLSAYNKEDGPFTAVELDIFASLTRSISKAVENAWLFQRNRMRQQELLENRNTLQALIDGIPHPIYTINEESQLVSINKSKHGELADDVEQVAGQICYRVFFQRDSPCDHCCVAKTLERKESQHWTVSWTGQDHLQREWDVSAYPIPGVQSDAARAVVVWQDRTEERRLEASLLQAGKLAAIGRLAAGVAHEINNPLTAVNANAQLLQMAIPRNDENYESVELIARAGERAAKVVRGLLDFARQEKYTFAETDINSTLRQALALVQYQLDTADIEVVEQLAEDLPHVIASGEHLKSVWVNLLINARDAVQELSSQRLIEITTRTGAGGDHIQILIRDNGKGMSAAESRHIFEPFYTTKDPGKGTGLGLATSHRIIEQHGGEIGVASSHSEGTTFVVRLPLDWRPDNHAVNHDEQLLGDLS